MNGMTKEQVAKLAKTMDTVRDFKQLCAQKGSREETIRYLMQETGLTNDECSVAYDFYTGIKLP